MSTVSPNLAHQTWSRFSMSLLRARIGVMYSKEMPFPWTPEASLPRRGSNAASVFPDPVGATTNTSSPLATMGQACACGGVGSVIPVSTKSSLTEGMRKSKELSVGN